MGGGGGGGGRGKVSIQPGTGFTVFVPRMSLKGQAQEWGRPSQLASTMRAGVVPHFLGLDSNQRT